MANLFLSWDEAKGEQLPHYCVSCGAPAAEWADWRLCHTRQHVFSIEYTYVDVAMPVCPEHRNLRAFLIPRIGVRKIFEDGVELSRLSPGFVDAVWDYREEREFQERQSHRSLGRSHSRNEDYVDYEEDDYENYEEDRYEPRRLPRRSRPYRYARSSSDSSLGKYILIAIAIFLLAPFLLMVIFMLLGLLMAFAI